MSKHMSSWHLPPVMLSLVFCVVCASSACADDLISEDFTGTTTSNSWYYFNGACLTASSSASSSSPGTVPGCTAIKSSYYGESLVGGYNGVAGSSQTLPDTSGYGALRFTNGCIYTNSCSSGGHDQNGAIISAGTFSSSAGLQVTFKTVTYRGDSGGTASDGADGMSFFLMDGSVTPNIGSWGGSLGYTCSNTNSDYHGAIGGYLGLGIDEYGNFLNGARNTLGTSVTASGDNTASGGGYVPNRIGIRGAGNINWTWLNANYPSYYPSSLSSASQYAAVQSTCKTGYLWNYSSSKPSQTSTSVMDYPAISGAYKVLSGVTIADEYAKGGYSRQVASTIMYKLKITENGLLSLSYSYNGGSWLGVISNQSITSANGSLPSTLRFGFAGSTGGSSNIHEILCFKAASADQAASSTTANQKESSKVTTGTQAYFSLYDPNDWTGRLLAYSLSSSSGTLEIASTPNWDASCVLTGVASSSTCPTTGVSGATSAEAPTSRAILTWSGSAGTPFEWSGLTSTQQSTLTAGDSSETAYRLSYLRGDRTQEMTTSGSGLYRDRDYVLGDIVDSSPTWVGPPSLSSYSVYATTWKDRLYPSTTLLENNNAYSSYVTSAQTRLNVVYVGANDGLLHGFRAGAFDSSGNYVSTYNDGYEVLAYMPSAVLNTIHSSSNSEIDYSNTQYGHAFYVDAPPGTGDLYYGSAWHTWLVGGLGPGGAAIYALDVTNPGNFSEANASSLVVGEWTSSTISCTNVSSCASNLGNTYGTPVIRRLHNGTWGLIFGNGIGSSSGDAGIFIITINPSTSTQTVYYLSTGKSGSNGIAYVSPVDIDGDHITDYVYAGDILGNVWRFDLTSSSASSWAVSTGPVFTTPSSQPITTQVYAALATSSAGSSQMMLMFGTGRKYPLTNSSATYYSTATESIYGVWDWNMSSWNALSAAQLSSLSASASGLSSPYTLSSSNLQSQTISTDSAGDRIISSANAVCWKGTSTCTSGNTQFGWYINLPGTNTYSSTTTYEQVIYNPVLVNTAIVFNSILPAVNSVLSCTTSNDQGWTYALDVLTGGAVSSFFTNNTTAGLVGIENDATGTPFILTTSASSGTQTWLVYQTVAGTPSDTQVTPANNVSGTRRTWIQLR
jgi:type IV pilus assembly protein PilY1